MVPTPPPARRRRARLLMAALAAATLALAAVGLARADLAGAASALAGANPQLLAAAVALYALAQTMSGAAWGVCQAAGGVRVPMPTTLGLHWIARGACELLPASLGEGARVAVVRRHPGGRAAGTWRVAGGLAGYKVVEAAATAAVVCVIALATPLPGPAAGLRWTAVGAVAGMAVLAALWRLGRAGRIARLLPGRLRDAAGRLGQGAAVLSDGAAGRAAGGLVVVAVLARIASLAALLAALGMPPQAAPLAYAAIQLAGIVPGAPGGAGTREVVLIPALALAHGVASGPALAFSVAVQGTALVTSIALAAAALAWLGPALMSGRRAPDPADAEAPLPAPAPGSSG